MNFAIPALATLVICTTREAACKSHCAGTCYSGRLFPEPQDIFYGKHLKGYSYKKITTDDPVKCYSSCVQDCRCKACQMKDSRCELLDEDKTSKADDFVAEPGYVYFDIKQTMYQTSSHMAASVPCYNGCCRSQPCLNGGTCVEHCQSSKEKFTCSCDKEYGGKVCQTSLIFSSCRDAFNKVKHSAIHSHGVYTIKRSDNQKKFKVFCQFNQDKGHSWVLIESFAFKNRVLFKNKPFFTNFSINQYADKIPNWDSYRLDMDDMFYFRDSGSKHFRSTCDYVNRSTNLEPDFLYGDVRVTDIFSPTIYGRCRTVKKVNLNGTSCTGCSVRVYTKDGEHLHLDQRWFCDFKYEGKVRSADYFGFYLMTDPEFTCTATPNSVTSWWLEA